MGYLQRIGVHKRFIAYTADDYSYDVHNSHIEFIRNGNWFVVNAGWVGMSIDNGGKIKNKLQFNDYNKIEFSYIFANGNLIFATQNKVYKSTDSLATIEEITVKDLNGGNYVPVTDSTNYRNLSNHSPVYINGKEVLMWGNYTNYGFADTDVNIYYTTEDLASVDVIYKFGYNSNYPDAVGDIENDVVARHVHAVCWDRYDNKFWITTGDAVNECHWITAELINNTWVFEVKDTGSWQKTGTLFFDEDYIYFINDSSEDKNGVWKVLREDINDDDEYVNILSSTYPALSGYADGDNIVFGYTWFNGIVNTIVISQDFGQTWNMLTISDGMTTEETTFLRPYIDNNVIRMDAKPKSLSAQNYTYYVQTVLLSL